MINRKEFVSGHGLIETNPRTPGGNEGRPTIYVQHYGCITRLLTAPSFSDDPNLRSSMNARDQVSRQYKTTGNIADRQRERERERETK
jgi:hypothetical protein